MAQMTFAKALCRGLTNADAAEPLAGGAGYLLCYTTAVWMRATGILEALEAEAARAVSDGTDDLCQSALQVVDH